MASDIYVTFGGDTAGLEASAATAKAQIQSLQRELAALGRQMQATGVSADSELGQKMLATSTKLVAARGGLAAIKGELAGLAGAAGFAEVGASAERAAASVVVDTRTMTEAIRGFADIAVGQSRRAGTEFVRAAFNFGSANPALLAMGGAIAVAAGALAYLSYRAYEGASAIKSIAAAAVVDQLTMTDAEAAKLRDTIASLADVSNSGAVEIARTFLAIGQGGPQIAEISSTYLPLLAQAMGTDAPKAAEKLAEMFAELSTKGRAYVADTAGVSAATIKTYDGYVAAGESGKAYAAIIDAMVRRLEAEREKAMQAAAAQHAHAIAHGAAMGSAEGLSGAERAQAVVLAANTEKIASQISALRELQGQLAASTGAANAFSRALDTALKLDKVGSEIAKTTGEIKEMKAALATATASGDATGAASLSAGIDRASDSLKKLQQQAGDGLLGRDLVTQTRDQIAQIDATFKGSTADRLQAERQVLAAMLSGDALNAEQRHQVEVDLTSKDKEIRDASYRAYEAGEEAKATAAALDKAKVIAIREQELQQATAIYGQGSDQAIAAEQKVVQAKEAAAKQGAAAAKAGGKDEVAATVEKVNAEVEVVEKSTANKIALYGKEAQAKQITEAQKVALTLAALSQGETAELAAVQKELTNDSLSLKQKQALLDEQKKLEQQYADAVVKIEEDAAAKVAERWNAGMQTINGAATSQIDGLLNGTENWRTASLKAVQDVAESVVKFLVNWGLQAAETFARNLISQNAWVAANITGNSLITASQTAAAGANVAAVTAQKTAIVASDSGQVGAGVAAFLAPFIGPAAIPAGSAAAASTLAIGAADIGIWDVPTDRMTLIHQNELVMPAAQAGAFRDMLSSGAGAGSQAGETHFHFAPNVSAIDQNGVRAFLAQYGPLFAKQVADLQTQRPSLRAAY